MSYMKRLVLIAVALIVLSALVFAADAPETVQNRLSIEFHSVTGTDSVSLDLVKYFGRKAEFVAAPTQFVNVEISPGGVATITPKDAAWKGIETVVFAVSKEFLVEEEKQPKRFLPKYKDLTKITTKDKIALISDAFTQEQYSTIVGKLVPEQVTIVSTLTEDALSMDLNKELTINFSLEDSPVPSIQFNFRSKEGNITLANYSEPNNAVFVSLLVLGIVAVVLLGFYMNYMAHGPLRKSLEGPKKAEPFARAKEYKGDYMDRLKQIKKQLGKEKPGKLYKDTLLLVNSFLSKAFRISSANAESRLGSMDIDSGLKSDILSYITDYREAAYNSSDIKKEDAETLISLAESILKGA